MKKIALLVLTITISLTMAFGVSAKSSLTIKKVTNKSKKVTITFPSKAKWKVKVYAKKVNKKKFKKIASLTTPKVSSAEIKIKKQSKSSIIKVITNKKGKKKTYSTKIKVVEYTSKKSASNNSNNNKSTDNQTQTCNNSSNSSSGVTADTYWWDYYKTSDPDFKLLNSYTLIDVAHDDGSGENITYAFICGSTIHSVRWYYKSEYDAIMNEVKKIVKESQITDTMTDQEKGFRLGSWLAKNIKVPKSGSPDIYGCLINKESMCMGLAEAYSVLCKYVGIDCDCVYNEGHEWNIMKVGKYWYQTDVYGMRMMVKYQQMYTDYLRGFYDSASFWDSLNSCFKTNEFIKSHPSTDLSFVLQSKKDGTPYILGSELEKLVQ